MITALGELSLIINFFFSSVTQITIVGVLLVPMVALTLKPSLSNVTGVISNVKRAVAPSSARGSIF